MSWKVPVLWAVALATVALAVGGCGSAGSPVGTTSRHASISTSNPPHAAAPSRAATHPVRTQPPTRSSTTPGPAPIAQIKVYADCRIPTVEPGDLILTCADANTALENVRWSTWSTTQAVGVGTLRHNDCTPDCATGHFHGVPNTRVTLSAPVPDVHGQLVWSRSQESPLPPGWATGPLHGAPIPLPTGPM